MGPLDMRVSVAAITVSVGAIAGIVAFEGGFVTETYKDHVGVPTICAGHTGPDVKMGQTRTVDECMQILQEDLDRFEKVIKPGITLETIKQREYDAIVSFTHNIGPAAFAKSTFLKKLNAGDSEGAADEMLRWSYAGGAWSKGLHNRRKCERGYFLGHHDNLADCREYFN